MDYGYFSSDGYEYIITNPNTPRPWINYLTNENYCAVISATAGGYSFYKDSKTERLLWFLGPNLFKDRPGRYIFVREPADQQTGEPAKVFSLTWQPLRKNYDAYECHVGIGYQTIKQKKFDLETEVTYFVPREETCEVWLVKIRNRAGIRNLSLFGYLEWWLGSTDYINLYNIAFLWNRVVFNPQLQALIAWKTAFYEEFNIKNNPYLAFFATSQEVWSWDAHKYKFLGRYNTEENPEGVFVGRCTQSICDGEEGIGVLQINLQLKPGEEKELVFILGQTRAEATEVAEIINKYRNLKTAKEELEAVKKIWKEKVSPLQIETPDSELNQFINVWAKYQLFICNYWSRSPSFYHEGQGGRGYRDSCQDSAALVSLDPQHSKNKIQKIASLTRKDGTVAPGWSDTYGPYPNRPFKDHPTWLTATVFTYVKETGDLEFLQEKIPYLKDRWRKAGTEIDPHWKGGAKVDGEGTLFEHLLTQLNLTYQDVSVHGIPRVGEADWNDALDLAGRRQIGESVWLGMALVRSQKMLAELAEKIGKNNIAEDLREKAQIMTERLNQDGWDAAWYLGGYNDDLVPFGSSKNTEGKIFLNSQSWAILAGIVPQERLPLILNAVEKHLSGEHGLELLAPNYTKFDPGLGRIAMFSKGTKENGAIFGHAHNFMVAAYCQLGMGNKAYETFCKILPNKQKDSEVYKAEPYVYAEYLIGPEHPYAHGEGWFTWLTGTAGWGLDIVTKMILGVQPEIEGLKIDPCLPAHWKKCKIIRPFRGATYEIEIENPEGLEHGAVELTVDGKKMESNLLPPHQDGKIHKVKVILKK